jgi:uncharacterized protein (TIGR03435 family)
MRKALSSFGSVSLVCAAVFGQAAKTLTFEVASVKPAAPPAADGRMIFGSRGGPGTPDPGQITLTNGTLKNLLMAAYDLKPYQIKGPGWLDTERYDIIAKVAEGATKEQVAVMWQHLLKERFGMVVHHESKEFQVEELQVAKGGSKLKETTLDPNAPPAFPPAGPPKLDKNGFPDLPGPGMITMVSSGPSGRSAHTVAKGQPLSQLTTMLANQLNRPVLDKTGLTGKFDFTIEYIPDLSGLPPPGPPPGGPGPGPAPGAPGADASEPGSNLVAAIQQQLGLRLVSGKAKLDVVVVDKAEKVPTEN